MTPLRECAQGLFFKRGGNLTDVWTVGAALEWTEGYLGRHGDENPRGSARWLLGEACGLSRIELYTNLDRPLSADERAILREWVSRRGAGEPLQYITGEAAFRYLTVKVRPGVLIPRPETEVLVSEGMAFLRQEKEKADSGAWEAFAARERRRMEEAASDDGEEAPFVPAVFEAPAFEPVVLDLCTGSGCIACSIAREMPGARVIATDISCEAVSLARENVAALELAERVAVLECDLGEKVPDRFRGAVDLVVSNPPYVPTSVMRGIPSEVKDFEPVLALDGGPDGQDVFRRIAPYSFGMLKPGAMLAVELHEEGMDAAEKIARSAGFEDVRIVDDLAGRPRVLTARKPSAVEE